MQPDGQQLEREQASPDNLQVPPEEQEDEVELDRVDSNILRLLK